MISYPSLFPIENISHIHKLLLQRHQDVKTAASTLKVEARNGHLQKLLY